MRACQDDIGQQRPGDDVHRQQDEQTVPRLETAETLQTAERLEAVPGLDVVNKCEEDVKQEHGADDCPRPL